MKCFYENTRGISIARLTEEFPHSGLFDESLLKRGNARFGDALVFADCEVHKKLLTLTAAESDDDDRALVYFKRSFGLDDDQPDDKVNFGYEFENASLAYDRVFNINMCSLGILQDNSSLFVIEPGGSVTVAFKRTIRHWPGFFAGLLGAHDWSEEVTTSFKISYDGNAVKVENLPEQSRQLDYWTLYPSRQIHLRRA